MCIYIYICIYICIYIELTHGWMYRIRDPFKGDVGFECEGNIYIYIYIY